MNKKQTMMEKNMIIWISFFSPFVRSMNKFTSFILWDCKSSRRFFYVNVNNLIAFLRLLRQEIYWQIFTMIETAKNKEK